jgi:hypothetical protein
MNVFVLCTGRCGSVTFVQACRHITNYTAAHESRIQKIGADRVSYPQNHIEADNRLSWFLGRLDRAYGDNAFYVHLTRNREDTARSFSKRWEFGIMRAYRVGILWKLAESVDPMPVCLDYCDTVTANIEAFLKDKTRTMPFALETAKADFERFWSLIGANGDLTAALAEWDHQYNDSKPTAEPAADGRLAPRITRLRQRLPRFFRNA